jgi:NADH dehydrogenase (ubiquinone) 1 beta subcomplex subunit 8
LILWIIHADPSVLQNGNYPDPSLTSALPVKRQHRDPYGEWWDPIEKRNYGEPVHEDNDILGVFSPDEYTHFKPGWGAVLFGSFVVSVGALCAVVYQLYPDQVCLFPQCEAMAYSNLISQPAVSRTFEGGLDRELGGSLAVIARASEDQPAPLDRDVA